jgi:hypothetical protein
LRSWAPVSSLPAAALAEDVDDASEAVTAVFPVSLKSALDAVCIASDDGGDDLVVLGDGEMEVVDDGAGVEPPVALGLRLDGFVKREKAGSGAGLDDGAMEVAVEVEDAGGARVSGGGISRS